MSGVADPPQETRARMSTEGKVNRSIRATLVIAQSTSSLEKRHIVRRQQIEGQSSDRPLARSIRSRIISSPFLSGGPPWARSNPYG